MARRRNPGVGNLNRAVHGARIMRLTVGELPRDLLRVKRTARKYRRDLEAAVAERHGEVSLVHAHEIDAAVGHEAHAAICRWLFCNRWDKMTVQDILACSKAIANAKDARNRIVRGLGLDAATGLSAIDALYSVPDITPDERTQREAISESSTQTDATGGDCDTDDGGQDDEETDADQGD